MEKKSSDTVCCGPNSKCSSHELEKVQKQSVADILKSTLHCRQCGSFSEEAQILPCGHIICSKHVREDAGELTFEEQMQRVAERAKIFPDMKPHELLVDGCVECKEQTWAMGSVLDQEEKDERLMLFRLCHLYFNLNSGCSDCVKGTEGSSTFVCLTCSSLLCADHKSVHIKTKIPYFSTIGHKCVTKNDFSTKFNKIVQKALEKRSKFRDNWGPVSYPAGEWNLEIIKILNEITVRDTEANDLIKREEDCIAKVEKQFEYLIKMVEDKKADILTTMKSKYDKEIEKAKARSIKLRDIRTRSEKARDFALGLKEFPFMKNTCIDRIIADQALKTKSLSSQELGSTELAVEYVFDLQFSDWFNKINTLTIETRI